MGIYDTAAAEGLLRIYPSAVARGAKGFGMGWGQSAISPSEWTDDGSSYVELHGGLAPTFADLYELPAGGEVTWRETWYPAAGIGQVVAAGEAGAASLALSAAGLTAGIYLPYPVTGATVTLTAGAAVTGTWRLDLAPDRPFRQQLSFPAGAVPPGTPVTLSVTDAAGVELYRYAQPAGL